MPLQCVPIQMMPVRSDITVLIPAAGGVPEGLLALSNVQNPAMNERLIADGREVRMDEAKEVWVLGTPEDLAHFHQNYEGGR